MTLNLRSRFSKVPINRSGPSWSKDVQRRVAKCHGYGGYIRVKKMEGWGKKSGRIHSFAKSSIVLGKFEQLI